MRTVVLALLLAFAPVLAAAQPAKARLEGATLSHLAVRQPMLAERIAKLYVQVGQDVLAARTHRSLPAAMKEFESGLEPLLAGSANAEIRETYLLLALLWKEFRVVASKPPSADNAKKLAEQNDELVWVAAKGARLVRAQSRAPGTELVLAAGELRLLSQRIAKLHLFRHWGLRSDRVELELAASDADFRKSLALLMQAPGNSIEVNAELSLAQNQYFFLGQAVERLNAGKDAKRELEHVVKTCDNILEVMDRVVQLYEAAGA
ncbi:hypothetical protein [Usitatibacter palustris]|uniref:Type IV pili methyl-accepting chemotaxis transducer N-term n=1 Tax=Usitatibacter palustris TaxID=2732487 RepID=A0A6M4H982_9PROT|nr:hypothetical protein [Usitatibacter palustris]QJR16299.1 hypothetical protein DSM104440_03128 [Usitatibacter palustris]